MTLSFKSTLGMALMALACSVQAQEGQWVQYSQTQKKIYYFNTGSLHRMSLPNGHLGLGVSSRTTDLSGQNPLQYEQVVDTTECAQKKGTVYGYSPNHELISKTPWVYAESTPISSMAFILCSQFQK